MRIYLQLCIHHQIKDSISSADLGFRDFLSVALVIDTENTFPDNWIYIHEPDVKVGRVQNYGSWSPYLVKKEKLVLA